MLNAVGASINEARPRVSTEEMGCERQPDKDREHQHELHGRKPTRVPKYRQESFGVLIWIELGD